MITGAAILAVGVILGYVARMLSDWDNRAEAGSETRWADEYFTRWQEAKNYCPGCKMLEIKSDRLLRDIDGWKRIRNRLSPAASKEWDGIAESLES